MSSASNNNTLVQILRERAAADGDRLAFAFLENGEAEAGRLTYADLDRRARAIGARLQTIAAPGDRALLPLPQGLDFVAAFFGCLYAGMIAVPTKAPAHNRKNVRLDTIVADAGATVALGDAGLVERVREYPESCPGLETLSWIVASEVPDAEAAAWIAPAPDIGALAFLQYTSGSTSDPKGVMVTHDNLAHNALDLTRAWPAHSGDVMVSWVPTFHDLGLVFGVVYPVFNGIPCYLMTPAAFLAKPARWLDAMSRYGATHTSGPNFAFDLCVDRIAPAQRTSLDLRRWAVTINGGEPVREGTVQRFQEAFGPCGFSAAAMHPSFGLAESTLRVTSPLRHEEPRFFRLDAGALARGRVIDAAGADVSTQVALGRAGPDTQIFIVDPETAKACESDEVGEIWVAGPSIAAGYWRKTDETARTFQARRADTGEGPFLRTGDLGFLRDGQLCVTGRIKDVLIIHGLNHYPQDVELTVDAAHPALRRHSAAAFTITAGGEERLVVVQEVERTALRNLDAGDVVGAIRQAVAEQHDLQVHGIALLRPGALPKTSSGKVQRQAARRAFLEGTLDAVSEWRQPLQAGTLVEPGHGGTETGREPSLRASVSPWPVVDLRARVLDAVARCLKTSAHEIDTRQPLARYGMESVSAVALSAALGEIVGRTLEATIAYDYPTVDALVRYLEGSAAVAPVVRPSAVHEPIAIVGLGCRLPGAANPDALWQLLKDGVDAVREVPSSRWDAGAVYDPEPATTGRTNSRWGGFLDQDIAGFDAAFFGIAPREAENMDPQQRLLLEVSWEALEDAGLAADRLAGSATGVFVGISTSDYLALQLASGSTTNAYTGTGTASSVAASRLSYVLDLRGPAWAVDTACSSSLVAVHSAIRSLRAGECDLALAGGVNLMLTPDTTIALSQARMLSSTGRCRAFDADADGYVRGEGCGIVVLRRLSDAKARGDRIVAVIRGSAVNQDGRSNGLTAPNGIAQRAVIRQALEDAGVYAADVSYVEAHGSATPLGDPIELNALKDVLADGRPPDRPFRVGSIKTNIGHLEAAAGVAGLIKVALSLAHGEIPRHLHLRAMNPHVVSSGAAAVVPTRHEPWEMDGRPRIGAVSSFGFGGTNAHVVLEESLDGPVEAASPGPAKAGHYVRHTNDSRSVRLHVDGVRSVRLQPDRAEDRPANLLVLSARTDAAFHALAERFDHHLQTVADAEIPDVCHTAATGRAQLERRAAVLIRGRERPRLAELRPVASEGEPKIAFLFTGQGSQYPGMGRDLYETQPVFRDALDRCAAIVALLLEHPLLEVMFERQDGTLDQTAYTQPALFALEYALANLWMSWGMRPAAMLGHSVGEYVAACLAGVFPLESALGLIAARGRLMQALPGGGAMAAVRADESAVAEAIARLRREPPDVSIAAVNGPGAVVVSGAEEAVSQLARQWPAQRLRVSHAFHSPLMEPMLPRFEQLAKGVTYHAPSETLIANVTGLVAGEDVGSADYWVRHIVSPVLFAKGMHTLREAGISTFLEVGPSPVLVGMAAGFVSGADWLASLRPGQHAWESMLTALGRLYEKGARVDWDAVDRGFARRKVTLPTYPFERKRYWVDLPPRRTAAAPSTADLATRSAAADPLDRLLYALTWDEVAPKPLADVDGVAPKPLADVDGVAPKPLADVDGVAPKPLADVDGVAPKPLADVGGVAPKPLADVAEVAPKPLAKAEPAHIVDLRHLDRDDASAGCMELLKAVQRRGDGGQGNGARIWLVTRDTPAHAAVQGFGRVVALERPESWGGSVVLGAEPDSTDASRIAHAMRSAGEDEVAFRGGAWHGRRLRPLTLRDPGPFAVPADDAMLVTGGLGSIGIELARWLAARGARQLVLLGRRPPSAAAAAAIAALEQDNVQVLVVQADVSNREETTAAFTRARAAGMHIRGIFHAAGTAGYAPINSMTPEDLDAVLAAKMQGTLVLDDLSRDPDLRHFVVFSSIASAWGAPGLAHYAAANASLDALIHERRRRGACGLTVNWGPWSAGGVLSDEVAAAARRTGLRPLPSDIALSALGRLLQSDVAQAVVADVDWATFKAAYELRGRRRLLEHIVPVRLAEAEGGPDATIESGAPARAVDGTSATPARSSLRVNLEALPPPDRLAALADAVRRDVALTLKLDRDALPDTKGFFAMGMDSLMALDLRRRLEATLGLSLPATVAFDYPNIQALTSDLARRLGWTAVTAAPPAPAGQPGHAARMAASTAAIDGASDADVDALIDRELQRLEALIRDH